MARKKATASQEHLSSTTKNFPISETLDWLFIMGGSMNIYEEEKYPWLKREKNFIAEAISSKKNSSGSLSWLSTDCRCPRRRVSRNKYKEIGWFPVILTKEAKSSLIFSAYPIILRFTTGMAIPSKYRLALQKNS